MPQPPHLWVRHETRQTERRAPITPADGRRLVDAGATVTVERSPQRIFPIEEYAAAGCRVTEPGSWSAAPADDRDRRAQGASGPADRVAPPARVLRARVQAAGGRPRVARPVRGRRRRPAGHRVPRRRRRSPARVLRPLGRLPGRRPGRPAVPRPTRGTPAPVRQGATRRRAGAGQRPGRSAGTRDRRARSLRPGRAGRAVHGGHRADLLGRGARPGNSTGTPCCGTTSSSTRCWRTNRSRRSSPTPTSTARIDRLSLICDVTCDVGSPCNALPIYERVTSWPEPVVRLRGGDRPADLLAIDNLPSLLPLEASMAFSAELTPHLLTLEARPATWRRCEEAFRDAGRRWIGTELRRCLSGSRPAVPCTGWVPGCPPVPGWRSWARLSRALTVWGRTEDKARACLDRQGLTGQGRRRGHWTRRCSRTRSGPATPWCRCCPPASTPPCCDCASNAAPTSLAPATFRRT